MDQIKPEMAKQALHNPKTMKAMRNVSKISLALGFFMVTAVLITAFVKFITPAEPIKVAKIVSTPTPAISRVPTLGELKINLSDPLTCEYSTQGASVSAFIRDQKVAISLQEASASSKVLLNGDCIYNWKGNEVTGTKTCNIQPILQTVNILSSFGGMSLESLLKMLPKDSQSKILSNPEFVNNIISSCIKEASNSAVFTVPSNVFFQEASQSGNVESLIP